MHTVLPYLEVSNTRSYSICATLVFVFTTCICTMHRVLRNHISTNPMSWFIFRHGNLNIDKSGIHWGYIITHRKLQTISTKWKTVNKQKIIVSANFIPAHTKHRLNTVQRSAHFKRLQKKKKICYTMTSCYHLVLIFDLDIKWCTSLQTHEQFQRPAQCITF